MTVLLLAGAKPGLMNHKRERALDLAEMDGDTQIATALKQAQSQGGWLKDWF